MYKQLYNFSEKPFEITSNPRFLYINKENREVLASLIYGIQQKRGIFAIIGEVGTGKTTFLKAVVRKLKNDTDFAFIFNTDTSFSEQVEMVLEQLKILSPVMHLSTYKKICRLKKFAEFKEKKNKNVAIIVDEAQNLSYQALEKWRLLSNIESESGKLIQIIFSGQPEFEKKLKEYRLRQLDQRISHKQYISPLNKEETYEYVKHRLKIAGGRENTFCDNSLDLVWRYSEGIPRKINILCDNALLIGFSMEKNQITQDIVREAMDDLTKSPFLEKTTEQDKNSNPTEQKSQHLEKDDIPGAPVKSTFKNFRLALAAGLLVCIGIAAGIYFQFLS